MTRTYRRSGMATSKARITEYNESFHKTVARLAKTRKTPFTIDDVVAKVGNPPQGRKALGALIGADIANLKLQVVALVPSRVKSRRGALNNAYSL